MAGAILYAHGANSGKHPVTAFDTVGDCIERLMEDPDIPIEVSSVRDNRAAVVLSAPKNKRDEVAEQMFDSHYFVGDPPRTYEVEQVDGELGVLYATND